MKKIFFAINVLLTISCKGIFNDELNPGNTTIDTLQTAQTLQIDTPRRIENKQVKIVKDSLPPANININVPADSIVYFAETLIGIPYKYGSTNPTEGFDCSGFITYVFNHFHINVPRSSIDFTNVGTEILLPDAKRGDLVLFTGTDSTERFVGHMGIIVSNSNGVVQFIHSTSGKAFGVTITPLNNYYMGRFVKVIRL